MNYKLSKKFTVGILVGLLLFVIWLLGLRSLLESIEILTYDWRAQLAVDNKPMSSKFKKADPDIILLNADDYSFQKLSKYPQLGIGRWPWSRKVFGDVVNFVEQGKPKVMAFDIKFEGMEGESSQNKISDAIFTDSIKNQNIVLGIALTRPALFISDKEKIVGYLKILNTQKTQIDYFLSLIGFFDSGKTISEEDRKGIQKVVDYFLSSKNNSSAAKTFGTNMKTLLDDSSANAADKEKSLNYLNNYKKKLLERQKELLKEEKAYNGALSGCRYEFLEKKFAGYVDAPSLQKNLILKVDDSAVKNLNPCSQTKTSLFDNITFYNFSSILNSLLENTSSVGVINLKSSENSTARYHVPLYRVITKNETFYLPSLPLATILSVLPEKEKQTVILKKNKIIVGKREIPVDSKGRFLINWHGKGGTYKGISIAKVILTVAYSKGLIKEISDYDKISPEEFKDKIVIVGQNSTGSDIHATTMEMAYPGAEIIATATDNILNDADKTNPMARKFIKRLPPAVDFLIALVFCGAVIAFNIRAKSILVSVYYSMLIAFLFILLSIFLFVNPSIRLSVNMVYPLIFMSLAAIGSYIYKIYIKEHEKKEVENLFGKFLSPQLLNVLLKDPKLAARHGKRKLMTVLFSDIRNFTTLSENTSPDKIIEQLNEYMTEMVEIVLKNNGTFDKYIGDAVMAFYGDPVPMHDHALMAVKTALEMMESLKGLNEKWKEEGKPELDIGLGINTGDMIVGHMGSPRLLDYTVIGDNVNLASRLEGLNKEYKTHIIISEATYNDVKDEVDAVYLGECTVKGKAIPIRIYEVKGLKSV